MLSNVLEYAPVRLQTRNVFNLKSFNSIVKQIRAQSEELRIHSRIFSVCNLENTFIANIEDLVNDLGVM